VLLSAAATIHGLIIDLASSAHSERGIVMGRETNGSDHDGPQVFLDRSDTGGLINGVQL
jgi:hypothetical protein